MDPFFSEENECSSHASVAHGVNKLLALLFSKKKKKTIGLVDNINIIFALVGLWLGTDLDICIKLLIFPIFFFVKHCTFEHVFFGVGSFTPSLFNFCLVATCLLFV